MDGEPGPTVTAPAARAPGRATGRRLGPRGRLGLPSGAPGPLLALAVLGLVWGVVRASGVSLPALHEIHAEAFRTYGIGGEYVVGWDSGEFNPFEDGRLSALTVLLCPVWLSSVMAIGRPLVLALPGARSWPGPVVWFGAFLPGYLIVLAPLHLLLSALPLPAGARVALVAVPVAALLMHRGAIVEWVRRPRRVARPRRAALWARGAVAAGLALALVHRLQAGRNFMVPDSGIVLLDVAEVQRTRTAGLGRYLAHWDQQADEWVFNAPLMFFRSGGRDFLFPLYVSQAVALVSFVVLVGALAYVAAPRRRLLTGVVVGAVVLVATPVIDPRYYVSLWGGQTPTMWLGHPGREIAIVAPWAVLLVLCRGPARRPSWAVLALATLGLAFISVHAIAFVVVAVVGFVAWRALAGRRPRLLAARRPRGVLHAAAVASLLAPLAVFFGVVRLDNPDHLAWGLLAGAVVGVGAAVTVALASRTGAPVGLARDGRGVGRPAAVAVAWLGVLAVGMLLSGNMTGRIPVLRDALGALLPGYDQGLVTRGLLGTNPLADLSLFDFSGGECSISGHCTGGAGYLAGYGLMSLAAIAGWIVLARRDGGDDRGGMRAAWLVCAALLSLAFVLVDFTGSIPAVAWIFTRFLEVPFYGLLGLAMVALVASAGALTSRVTVALAAVWVIVPFASNATPDQWMTNVRYLVDVL
jgi:hypothetical protein